MSHEHMFARDGHLTMLSLDRYDVDELDRGARRSLELHVEGCGQCRARLRAVATPGAEIEPRMPRSRSAGSAYLATVAAIALAATVVLALGSAMVPIPRAAHESAAEPPLMGGSYTSVAQEYGDTSVDVELIARGDRVVATPTGDAHLAIIVLARSDDAGDTDGGSEADVVEVLHAPRAVSAPLSIAVPRRWTDHRVVAIACPGPFTVEVGESFLPDRGCIVRER